MHRGYKKELLKQIKKNPHLRIRTQFPQKSAHPLIKQDKNTENPAERKLKDIVSDLCEDMGLSYQEEYKPVSHRKWRVDIAVPELQLAFECDGWQYHARSVEAWKKEKARDRALMLAGWITVRFAASEILYGMHDEYGENIELKEAVFRIINHFLLKHAKS